MQKSDCGMKVAPVGDDLQEWLFVFPGAEATPYEGGEYMGRIKFGETWPFKAPVICLLTPSGRFEPGKALCINGISHYHNDNYSSSMSVESILTSLLSYMADDGVHDGTGIGIIKYTDCPREERVRLAKESHSWNLRDVLYQEYFAKSQTSQS